MLGEEQLHLANEQAKYVLLRGEWTVEVEEASARFVLFSVCCIHALTRWILFFHDCYKQTHRFFGFFSTIVANKHIDSLDSSSSHDNP